LNGAYRRTTTRVPKVSDWTWRFEAVFDEAIVFHGFTDYMRDYEIIIHVTADPRTNVEPKHVRLLFKHCVRATVTSAVSPETWRRSLDDRLIDYEQGVDLDGYVWGVKWQVLYPGITLLTQSEQAERWSTAVGIPFSEARLETNGHSLSLVFADLEAASVEPGYAPQQCELRVAIDLFYERYGRLRQTRSDEFTVTPEEYGEGLYT
jgi:hypothetical protein